VRAAVVLVAVLALAGATTACGDDGPSSGDGGTTTSALSPDALPVFIANERIPAGTDAAAALDDGRLREERVSRDQFPEDAIVSAELIEDKVAAEDLPPGTIITAGMFVEPTDG
jgi:flagella basal body P-ring formation protein FlgA